MPAEPALLVKGVSKSYKVGREVLHAVQDASFVIPKGQLVAVVGPSGSGKTTLSHLLGGLMRPDEGQIIADGIELTRLRDRKLSDYRNKHIGFVFQNFSLLPGYSALENVSMPLMVAKMSPRERKRVAREYLEMVGLGAQATQAANQLSGGQRQRVAIARALAMQPSLIIADEPTGSLDSARGHEVMDILEQLVRKDMTVVMVTHDLELAKRADRQLHMLDGRVKEIR